MSIKEIVVHQGPDPRSETRLAIAADLAQQHDARLIGVFVKPDPRGRGAFWSALSERARTEWRAKLDEACGEAEAAFSKRISQDGIEGEWRTLDGDVADAIMTCARYADLTVIGQTDPDNPMYGASMPDEVVLGAGGPVLIIPYAGRFPTLGKRAMVAWNGGREAARAIHDALPFLAGADLTTVYSVNPSGPAHLGGADICAYLARHGAKAEANRGYLGPETSSVSSSLKTMGGYQRGESTLQPARAEMSSNDVGDAILSALADCGADLLVMGAYGHSRVSQIVLGGATREIMRSMTVPVLMSC